MGKRLAEKQLSKEDLLNSSDDQDNEDSENEVKNDSKDEIAQRKIVKVKRSIQSNQDKPSQGKLQLTGGLDSLAKVITPNKNEVDAQSEKIKNNNDDKSSKSGSLFNFSTNATAGSGSLFGGSNSTSLFNSGFKLPSNTAAGSSVFSTASLFGGQSTGGSLFGQQTGGSLFGAQPNGSSLFNQGTSLFGGQNTLFQAPNQGKKDEDEGSGQEEEDDDEPKVSNSPPSYQADGVIQQRPVKLNIESKPIEKSPYNKIFNTQVDKFKLVVQTKNKNEKPTKSMGRGILSIEFAEIQGGQKVYLCVFRNLIGKTLYQGTISAQFSKKRRIEEKATKSQLKVALVSKNSESKKLKVDYCIVSFQRSDDLKEFERLFDEAIVALKASSGAATDSSKQQTEVVKKVD